ncbi:dysbindin-like isoform X1 [Archocentrus centrarchus]|uniref:dysbindin-like isoform X1 n=1 Tax=Archocentrus centrarchus TaxID=63155 RepID=UPI0011EA1233|nr:dysbindin-like isoform X1 [Archocentrus centrarchus]
MSSTGSTNRNKRLASETDKTQRVLDNDTAQHLKLRDRQRFFEEVYQHDTDNYLPTAQLQIDHRKPPMGSISSMEVNVDALEQMDLMDVSDHEALDVFLNSGSEADEGALASPLPEGEEDDEDEDNEDAEVVYRECASQKRQNEPYHGSKSRISSTSSASSDSSTSGMDTPVIQLDDEEVHADTLLLTSAPQTRDEETEDEEEEEEKRYHPTNHQKA